jgi:alpha-beta hydrolase superfamily lysophospholipase
MAQSLLDPDCRLTLMGHSMGGMALMEFTKRYYEPEIQSLIDRVIIIDIPAVSINEIDPISSTGTMLKRMT